MSQGGSPARRLEHCPSSFGSRLRFGLRIRFAVSNLFGVSAEGAKMNFSVRRLHTLLLVLCAGTVTACGLAKPMPPLESFSHRIADGTVALYWNCSRPAAGAVRVDGWANNPYGPGPITDLGLTLYGVNAQGSSVSQAKANVQLYQIQTNEPSAFTIDFRTVGGEVRYDLVYEYSGGGDGGGRRGMLGAGAAERKQNMARDVCAGLRP